MDKFKIRTYGRTELAQVYNPHLSAEGAYRKLMQWIDHAPEFKRRLYENGNADSRTFSPRQVKLIVEHFGEP